MCMFPIHIHVSICVKVPISISHMTTKNNVTLTMDPSHSVWNNLDNLIFSKTE